MEEAPETAYTKNPDSTRLYINLAQRSEQIRNTVVQQMDEYKDEV